MYDDPLRTLLAFQPLYSTSSVMFIVRVSCYEYPMLLFHWLHILTLCKGKLGSD